MFLRKILVGILLGVSISAKSQISGKETFASAGSSHFIFNENQGYFIQQSIGQASVINTFITETNLSLRQGFIQPLDASMLVNVFDDTIDAAIWPNPFFNSVNIRINEPLVGSMRVIVYDLVGRVLFDKLMTPTVEFSIPLERLSQGTYLLLLQSKARTFTTKLIKR